MKMRLNIPKVTKKTARIQLFLAVILLSFFTLQASGQALFYAHNRTQVTACTVSDADAAAFLARVEASGATLTCAEKGHVNTYITGLKTNGLYTGITELYITFLGDYTLSTAQRLLAFKDAAHNLTQVGGTVTYSTTGVWIPADGYWQTGIPTTTLPQNGHYLALYSQTDGGNGYDIASYNISNNNLAAAISIDGANLRFVSYDLGSFTNVAHPTDKRGFFVFTRNNAATSEVYRNGTLYNTKSTASATPLETSNLVLGSPSWVTGSGRYASVIILGAEGLDATKAATLTTLTNDLLTAFGINTF